MQVLSAQGIPTHSTLSVKSKALGARIHMHRRRLGIKQVDLARLLGVAVSTMSSLERADNGMTLERLSQIIAALRMGADEFFAGEVVDEEAAVRVARFGVRRITQQKPTPVAVDHSKCDPPNLCEECAVLMEAR